MKFLKKYWYILVIFLFTVGLGVMVYLTSQQLAQTQPVAPNVPQVEPQAAAPACKLTFNITIVTGTPTPTPTPTATPTPTPTPSPTNGPTATPTPTPMPQVTCNSSCTVNSDCQSGLACVDGACRNPSCTSASNCSCQVTYENPTPTPTPVAPAACNSSCTINTDCASGLVCVDNACRNASCTEQNNCICAAPTPKIPVSGTGPSVLGASIIAGGFLILLLGLAL